MAASSPPARATSWQRHFTPSSPLTLGCTRSSSTRAGHESGPRLHSDGVLLAVDIGNTNVKLGTFVGEELTATWRLETDATRMPDEYAVLLDWLLHRRGLG